MKIQLFSLDPKIKNDIEFKKRYAGFRDTVKTILKTPKMPIQTLDQAIHAWGMDEMTPEELESVRKQKLFVGMFSGTLFCLLAFLFFLNYWHNALGIFPVLEFSFAIF